MEEYALPWTTPTLKNVRGLVRNIVTAAIPGAILIGNSPLRVMADMKAGSRIWYCVILIGWRDNYCRILRKRNG